MKCEQSAPPQREGAIVRPIAGGPGTKDSFRGASKSLLRCYLERHGIPVKSWGRRAETFLVTLRQFVSG